MGCQSAAPGRHVASALAHAAAHAGTLEAIRWSPFHPCGEGLLERAPFVARAIKDAGYTGDPP